MYGNISLQYLYVSVLDICIYVYKIYVLNTCSIPTFKSTIFIE